MSMPTGWTWSTLSKVALWGSGGTPQAGDPRYYGGSIPWAVIGDLNDGIVRQTRSLITEEGLKNSSAKLVPTGSVLLAMYGSIGKLGIAGMDMATNQAIAFAIPNEGVVPKYLFYYLLSQRRQLDGAGKGATQRNISQTLIKPWPIPMAQPDEQRRIVDILEDHLSRLDAADAAIGVSMKRLKTLVTSSLARETASHAPMTTVGAEAVVVEYGTSSKTSASSAGAVPVLRMGNIKEGRLDLTSLKFLPDNHLEFPKLLLSRGDLLFNRTNSAEHVGKSAVYDRLEPASFASYLIRVRFNESVLPEWASMVINSPFGRSFISSVVSQQVGQANVNGTKLKAFPLPLPDPHEQRERIRRHQSVEDNAGQTLKNLAVAARRSQSLRRSLLAAAFSGRLAAHAIDADQIEELADV